MNSEWLPFLQQQNAQIDEGYLVHFGAVEQEQQALQQGEFKTALLHLGVLKVSGEDASDFLQGQLTNDIKQLADQHSQLSAQCSPKGRMLALFRIIKSVEDYYLILPQPMLAAIHKRLSMYVLRSKVSIEDVSDSMVLCGLSGENTCKVLAPLPESSDAGVLIDELNVVRIAGELPRLLVLGPVAAMQDLWQKLSDTQATGSDAWALQDIHAGLPRVEQATQEAFVPQMLNLQVINGVNFKKGCYTGQEVVARMQYLGKLKRRMHLAHCDGDSLPTIGQELFAAGSSSGQGAGKVVDARPAPTGGYDLLVVVENSLISSGEVRLENEQGVVLQFRELPYQVESK